MSDLTEAQLLVLRRDFIRDEWRDVPFNVGLSPFNSANRRNFFDDDRLKYLDDRITSDRKEELEALYDEKLAERLSEGDSDVDAASTAEASKLIARYRLIRAEARELMMEDASMRAALSVSGPNSADSVFKIWADANERDRAFLRSRAGALRSVTVERR